MILITLWHWRFCHLCAMFSKTFGYALRAAIQVASYGVNGEKVGLQDLADTLGLPRPFLGKIMQDLVRHGVLDSAKGPNGGFFVNEYTLQIPLTRILSITDGDLVFNQCAMGIRHCNSDTPCPLHDDFSVCRASMLESFSQKTLGNMAEEARTGRAFLVR
jgi:Rrf2 family protein